MVGFETPGQVASELFRCRRASELPLNHSHSDLMKEDVLFFP